MADVTGRTGSRTKTALLIGLGVLVALVVCGSAAIVFLVLTGIIAEPVTVIEQFMRALGGS
ncbi:MAG: hypothetical protein U1E08_05265 [Coriobacteriia bacterium]|nr:hypothetical protein [Coriobacteriia bacterium]